MYKSRLLSMTATAALSISLLTACNMNNDKTAMNNNKKMSGISTNNGYGYTTNRTDNRYGYTPVRTDNGSQYTVDQVGRRVRLCPCPNQTPPTQPTTPDTTTPSNNTNQKQTPAPTPAPTPSSGGNISDMAIKVIELTNIQRQKNGLPALQADTSLSKVAQAKSDDMLSKNYFSHTSPTYGSPFDMMKQFGITYRSAGENIAKGQRSAEEVVNAWMNSEGHRANILNPHFTHIGIGHTTNQDIWTQMFIGK
jgi:uncharacterized YkwD family protein